VKPLISEILNLDLVRPSSNTEAPLFGESLSKLRERNLYHFITPYSVILLYNIGVILRDSLFFLLSYRLIV
jgi:hypothetical protein